MILRKKLLRAIIGVFVLLILYNNLLGFGLLNLNRYFNNSTLGAITYHLNRISSQVNRMPYNQKIFIESALMVGKTEAALDSFYNYIITTKPEYISNDSVLRRCMVLALRDDKDVFHGVLDNLVDDQLYFINLIIISEASTVKDYEFALEKTNELLLDSEHKLVIERYRNDLIELSGQHQ